jgi:hypothetical protein
MTKDNKKCFDETQVNAIVNMFKGFAAAHGAGAPITIRTEGSAPSPWNLYYGIACWWSKDLATAVRVLKTKTFEYDIHEAMYRLREWRDNG